MALQSPAANLFSLTPDVWPTFKTTISAPWRSVRKLTAHVSNPLPAAQPFTTTSRSVESPVIHQRQIPECLASAPMASLRSLHSPGLTSNTQLSSISAIPPSFIFRSANPHSFTKPISTRTARQYSTFEPLRFLRNTKYLESCLPSEIKRRTVFGSGSSQNLLAHMEQTANNNPTSATAQNAFYSALLRADMPAILVERFQTGRYASNSACETTYQRALEKLARMEGSSVVGGGTQMQGRNMANEQMQALGQAVAAQMKGGQVAGAKAGTTGTGEKASPLYVVVEESMGSNIFKWVKFILYFGFFGYVMLVVLQLVVETSGVLKKVGGSAANEAQPQHQTVRFSDVHGCDEAKEELQELVEFLRNPDKFNTLGGKLPKGVLLTGPPGTGKTLLARAIAGEAGVPFFFMSGSEFDEIYVGVGAKRVRELFVNARAKAPAIIFIDELDAIGGKRNDRDPSYVKQSLNQLLTELDGFSQDSGVIIVAATNLPQTLDKALTRPGRFDRNVAVPLPDVRGRMAILKHHMKNMQIATDIDESAIARQTTGFSGAELENLVNQAAVHASRNKASKIEMTDLDWAKDRILMGAERRSAVIQEKDKMMTAYHEAGHALVAYHTKGASPVYKVTIMPRGHALGITHFMDEMDKVSRAKHEYFAQLDVALGGKVAEQLVYGDDMVTSGCSSDLSGATNTAYHMITQCGMSDTLGNIDLATNFELLSSETREKVENEVRNFIEEGRKRATALLNEKRKELDIVANALLEYEVLSLEEMEKILKGEKLSKMKGDSKGGMKLPEIVLPPGMSGKGTGGGLVEGVAGGKEDGGTGAGGAKL